MKTPTLVIAATLALTTAACARDHEAPQPQESRAAAEPKPAPEQRSPGKPSAPVSLSFSGAERLAIGVPATIRVETTLTADVDALDLSFALSPGLQGTEVPKTLSLGPQKAGARSGADLVLVPQAEGQHYLSVFVTTRQGAQTRRHVEAYPLILGTVRQKAVGEVRTGVDGRPVISLPAAETVK